jgi:oligopeptidase B
MEVAATVPSNEAAWKEVVAHDPDALLEEMSATNTHLAYEIRKEGLVHLMVMDRKSGEKKEIPFRDPVFTSGLTGNAELDQPFIRYHYTSLTTPNSIYDYDPKTDKSILKKEQEVPGGFQKEEYVSERRMAKAADGTEVPMSIVYKKGTKIDGTAPCLLYSYGSYGSSTDPGFSATRLVLLDRGFVFALAHIRGGSELGRKWYENGKMLHKMNTFTDFNSCAEYLVQQKFSAKDKLFAFGGSAGGLLMGAIINLRPDLYKGVVAAVPFVDVVTTMLDSTIPLTTNEYEEWGNPNKKIYYDYMKSYSPYDNVKPQAYPNLLVTTGLHDSQVQYWEPAKWVARLRRLKTNDNLVLLHTNMEAGHGGASGRFEYLKDYALMYGFMVMLANEKPAEPVASN